jgi:hypothetical protein
LFEVFPGRVLRLIALRENKGVPAIGLSLGN